MANEIVYVCKICGRAIRTDTPPKYCYFDKSTWLENIGDEDAIKMGLFKDCGVFTRIEFPGDFKYNPNTGDNIIYTHQFKFKEIVDKHTLLNYQKNLIEKIYKKVENHE